MEYCSKTPTVRPDQNTVQPDQREKEVEDRLKIMKDLKEAYEWAMEENWNAVTKYFEKNPKQLLHKMTVDGDTILHLAASCSRRKSLGAKFLKTSIKMLSSTGSDQGRVTTYDDRIALRVTDNYGNNILHEVSVSGNMEAAEYLVTYFNEPVPEEVMISTSRTDKDNYALQAQDTEARDSENYALQLLETKNYLGETPLFRAAALGHAELVKFYAGKLQEDNPAEEDLSRHFHRKDKKSILHIAVTAQHFGTALWLLEKYPKLAQEKEENGLTSLQLLAQMPTAFVPKFERSKWKMLIYYCLPVGGHAVTLTPHQKDDVESSVDSNHPRQSIFRNNLAVVMTAYHSLLGSLAKGPHREIIYNIWKEKKNKSSLKKLIQLLVQWDDYSWLITDKQPKIRTISLGSGEKRNKQKEAIRTISLGSGEKGKAAADEHLSGVRESTESDTTNGDSGCVKGMEATTSKKEARNEIYNSIPLLIAAITGFLPIVLEILKQYPQAVEHVNCYDRNILHLAIKNRQKKILDLIQSKPTLMSKLNRRIDHNGNTILHQAADRSYYSIALSQKLIGPAMQLQEELRWMLRIKEMLPPHYIMHHNENDQTAEELFNAGHDELLKSAQEWVKETAQSCSTVAVLVATVVFAAAYAIPGGFNDQSGRPVFQDNPLFLLFTCMDVVAIACSLSSVAFFLSVLSSPLEYPYFVKSIPRKVLLGFVLLFFSMATTMLAFGATILLLIRIEKKWTMSLLYPIAFFPVPLFGLLQFPMNQSVQIVFQKIYDWFFKPLGRVLGRHKKKVTIWGQE